MFKINTSNVIISSKLNWLRSSLQIQRIPQSPEKFLNYSQNKTLWLSVKKFDERAKNLDESIISAFENDYFHERYRESRLRSKRHSANDVEETI